jgi:FkbM family methyltransferase
MFYYYYDFMTKCSMLDACSSSDLLFPSNNDTNKAIAAPFPLILASSPRIAEGDDNDDETHHINLPEENDGIFHQDKCETWHHTNARHDWHCKIEWDEWMLANAFVQEGDVVIEFGARYGTTSCVLSRNVGKTGQVIAVEPDSAVHGHLLRNRYEHKCHFHVVLGTVSMKPQYKGHNSGYAGMTTSHRQGIAFPNMNVAKIETTIGAKINVALIDCEGKYSWTILLIANCK